MPFHRGLHHTAASDPPQCTPREGSRAARQWLQTIPALCQGIFIQKTHPVLIPALSCWIKAKARTELGLPLLLYLQAGFTRSWASASILAVGPAAASPCFVVAFGCRLHLAAHQGRVLLALLLSPAAGLVRGIRGHPSGHRACPGLPSPFRGVTRPCAAAASRLPLSGLLAAGGRPHPSPRAESQQWGCDVPRTCLGQHRGCRVLPARFRDLRHGFGLIQSWAMGERGCVLGKEMRRWQRARRPLGRGGATRREHPRIRTQGRRREPGTGSLGWPIPAIQLSRSAAPRTPRARRCRPGCPGSDPSAAQPAAPVRRRPPTARRGAAFASPSRGVVPADGSPYPPAIP